MSAKQDVPKPPEDATDREEKLWKELINRMFVMEKTQSDPENE